MLFHASSNTSTFNQIPGGKWGGSGDNLFGATTSGGSPTSEFISFTEYIEGDVKLDGSSHPVVRITLTLVGGASTTRYQYYYLLAQTVF